MNVPYRSVENDSESLMNLPCQSYCLVYSSDDQFFYSALPFCPYSEPGNEAPLWNGGGEKQWTVFKRTGCQKWHNFKLNQPQNFCCLKLMFLALHWNYQINESKTGEQLLIPVYMLTALLSYIDHKDIHNIVCVSLNLLRTKLNIW